MNVRLQRRFAFTAGSYFDNQLIMSDFEFKITMVTNSYDAECHNIALERIKFFVMQCLDSTIFIKHTNDRCLQFASLGINITTLPEEPIDQIIGLMLYCKLNAIMEDHMIVTDLAIESGIGDRVVYLHNEEEPLGPLAQVGWWNEPDLMHLHQDFISAEQVIDLKKNLTWREFDLAWPIAETDKPTGNVVVFPNFNKDETK